MSTRLYLSNNRLTRAWSVDGTVFTTFGSGIRCWMSERRDAPAVATWGVAEASTTRFNTLLAMFVSQPLKAQTIAGTLKGQIRAMESNAAADDHLVCTLQVRTGFDTLRGTLYASPSASGTTISATPGDPNYELDTSLTNRKLPPGWSGAGVSLSSVDAHDGDSLVYCVGYRCINTVNTSYTGTVAISSDQPSTDLAEDETATGDAWPWIEFSQTLEFQDQLDPLLEPEAKMRWATQPSAPAGQVWPRGGAL